MVVEGGCCQIDVREVVSNHPLEVGLAVDWGADCANASGETPQGTFRPFKGLFSASGSRIRTRLRSGTWMSNLIYR